MSTMGVRYPTGTECLTPQMSPGDRGPGTAALVEATVAFQAAVRGREHHDVRCHRSRRLT